jgi:serralysin
LGEDQIDLSVWPELRSNAQLTFASRSDGERISYRDDVLTIKSVDGQPINPASFGSTGLIGDTHIPQNITQGYSGPIAAVPDLPERPDYTPYINAGARRSKRRRRPKYSIQ